MTVQKTPEQKILEQKTLRQNTPARKIPAPTVSVETQPFWTAAREGRFVVPTCTACGKAHWYPRAICPFCGGGVQWRDASGKATVYTFSVMRRAKEPYAIAYVTLAEGPTMLTNIVDCDFDALRIGQPVKIAFHASEDGPPVPMFKPA
jgi:uncharacterized OB-fold protein